MPDSPSQGQDQLAIDAPSDTIWAIIDDSARLPAWVPIGKLRDAVRTGWELHELVGEPVRCLRLLDDEQRRRER